MPFDYFLFQGINSECDHVFSSKGGNVAKLEVFLVSVILLKGIILNSKCVYCTLGYS